VNDFLDFAVIGSGTGLEAWQARCLDLLQDLGGVRPVLRIITAGDNDGPAVSAANRHEEDKSLWSRWYRQYCLYPAARRKVIAAKQLQHVPVIVCRTAPASEAAHHLRDADIDVIAQYKLDFILHLGAGRIGGKIVEAARYGVWTFDYGDPEKARSGPPGFWEILEDEPATGAVLRRLTEAGASGIVLKRGFLKTIRYSYASNQSALLLECARWPAQVCSDIQKDNAPYLNRLAGHHRRPEYSLPSGRQIIRFLGRILRNLPAEMRDTFFRHSLWNIGVVHEPIHSFLQPGAHRRVDYVHDGPGHPFRADPFGIVSNGRLTVLYEVLDYRTFKGGIASIELERDSNAAGKLPPQPRPALDLPVHTSYPYLIDYQGEIYCVPETARLREVSLYRAVEFPGRWVKVAMLLRGVAALDATLFQYDGVWWLTCTDKDQGAQSKLFIWYAPDLLGPWQPHAANPVKIDIRSARPAGTPFVHQGQLYRPAQDCSRTYGGGIVIHRVTRLSPGEFCEEPAAIIDPDPTGPYPDGIHTLSAVGDMTLVDGKRFVFKSRAFRHALRRELAKVGLFRN
jgi:hypothetical protein